MMEGLLIKDFKLMKVQKNFILIFIALSVVTSEFYDNLSFIMSYFPCIMSLFTLSTISYDEFDNGNAFLFTLPVSRTNYVVEKYFLALVLGGGAWVFAIILSVISGILKGISSPSIIIMTALMTLPVLLIIQAVMIPVQLKFGSEKGRLAIIVAVGLFFMIGFVVVKATQMFGIDVEHIFNNLSMINMSVMVIALIIAAVIFLLISMKISITIMKNREF